MTRLSLSLPLSQTAILCMMLLLEFSSCFHNPIAVRSHSLGQVHGTKSIAEEDTSDHKNSGKKYTKAYDDSFVKRNFEETQGPGEVPPSPNDIAKPPTFSLEPDAFPFTKIVNQDHIKQAFVLAATNPRLGLAGILIAGGHGTGKSVLARATKHLFPSALARIKNSRFNIQPLSQQLQATHSCAMVDSFLKEEILQKNYSDISDLLEQEETENIPMPFVTVPLNVMDDGLLGSVDIEKSMETGQTCFSPGLLAKAHRGILYMDDFHLFEEDTANILMNVLADGYVTVEREGLSARYPCRPQLVVATYNPEEGDIREIMLDRFAMVLSSDAKPLSLDQRLQVVENVEAFHPGDVNTRTNSEKITRQQSEDTVELHENAISDTEIRENIHRSKDLLPSVKIHHSQVEYLCELATKAGCEGQRAELIATEIAKTVAALHGRKHVTQEDLDHGVLLGILPRAQQPVEIKGSTDQGPEEQSNPPSSELQPLEAEAEQPPPPPADDDIRENEDEQELEDTGSDDETNEQEDEEEIEDEEIVEIPKEFMFGVDLDIPIDPNVLKFQNKLIRKGKGGKRAKLFSLSRGKFVKAIFPKGERLGRLAIGATLRASAPHQKIRKELVSLGKLKQKRSKKRPKVYVTKDDFRIQRLARKAGTLVVFAVDASGSMALNRMGAAKGTAMLLLKEAYKNRDKIALIAFHGKQAQVLVPPTKSMSMTKNRLESMPCGGGSPLAHALETAIRTGLNEIKVKRDVGRVVIVLLTDGRANVPLAVSRGDGEAEHDTTKNGISSDRKQLKEEVMALGKQLSALPDIDFLCIDTEDQFIGTGIAKDVTKASMGTYHHLVGSADTKTVSHLVREGMQAATKT